MKKLKIMIRAVLSLVLLSCLLFGAVGCQGSVSETNVTNMIELSTWYHTSGVPNNLIAVNSDDESLRFFCHASDGYFWNASGQVKEVVLVSGETVRWDDLEGYNLLDEYESYVDIVVKQGEQNVGYAVVQITWTDNYYTAKVIKSVLFQKDDGEYRSVSILTVQLLIRNTKS